MLMAKETEKKKPGRKLKRMVTVRVSDPMYDDIVRFELDISQICRNALADALDKIYAYQGKKRPTEDQ